MLIQPWEFSYLLDSSRYILRFAQHLIPPITETLEKNDHNGSEVDGIFAQSTLKCQEEKALIFCTSSPSKSHLSHHAEV